VDAVNRGACIINFSQYPAEIEYLFLPCSFIQPAGKPSYEFLDAGVVTTFTCQISVNLKAQTIGSLRAEKRDMHIAAFEYMLDELHQNLKKLATEHCVQERMAADTRYTSHIPAVSNRSYNVDGLLGQIMMDCKVVFQRHARHCPELYINDGMFRSLVMEMLDIKQHAVSKLLLYVQDTTQTISMLYHKPLTEAHRERMVFLERNLPTCCVEQARAALDLCKIKGLVNETLNCDTRLHYDDVESPLIRASAIGESVKNITLLVRAGCDINGRDKLGQTAVYVAASNGNDEVIETLHKLGADLDLQNEHAAGHISSFDLDSDASAGPLLIGLNMDGGTPVYIAAWKGFTSTVEVLARLGANINTPDDDRCSPIFVAAMNDHIPTVEALMLLGADIDEQGNWWGETPFSNAARHGRLATMEALCRLGANVNKFDKGSRAGWLTSLISPDASADSQRPQCRQRSSYGYSPFLSAVRDGRLEVLEPLARMGAVPHALDDDGCGAVYIAAENGHTEVIRVLLSLGCNASFAGRIVGKTPMQVALENGHLDCVRVLSALGGSSNGGDVYLDHDVFGRSTITTPDKPALNTVDNHDSDDEGGSAPPLSEGLAVKVVLESSRGDPCESAKMHKLSENDALHEIRPGVGLLGVDRVGTMTRAVVGQAKRLLARAESFSTALGSAISSWRLGKWQRH
jgi:ankyrin repeat protein